jgi:hypothetical protein
MKTLSKHLSIFFKLALAVSLLSVTLFETPGSSASTGLARTTTGRTENTTTLASRYWSAPGTSFTATSSGEKWDINSGQHCVYAPTSGGGNLWMERGLELPHGAHVTRLEMVAVDGDAVYDSAMWLEVHSATTAGVLASYSLQSAGASGTGIWGTSVDFYVDNYNYYYTLAWFNNGITGWDIALCGVVVTYEATLATTYAPMIAR